MSGSQFYISDVVLLFVSAVVLVLQYDLTEANETCFRDDDVELFLSVGVNATGHPQVNVRLDQPLVGPEWHMNIKLSSDCSRGAPTRKILSFTLTGSELPAPLLPRPPPPPPPTAPSPTLTPPAGYSPLPGLGFFRVSREALEWQQAVAACAAENATLAAPASEREAAVMAGGVLFNATGAKHTHVAWVGASDVAHEGRFVTVQGVLLEDTGFSKWHPTEPNGGTSENCLGLTNQVALIDASCKWKLAYICKLPLKLL